MYSSLNFVDQASSVGRMIFLLVVYLYPPLIHVIGKEVKSLSSWAEYSDISDNIGSGIVINNSVAARATSLAA